MKKITQYILPIFLIGLFFIGCQKKSTLTFKLTPEEALKKVTATDYILSEEGYAQFIDDHKDNFTFIDLRSPAISEQNPMDNAINIPIVDLLEKENIELMQSKEFVLLYGDTNAQANDVWLLLTQLGFENVKVSTAEIGGVPEKANYDFAVVFNEAKEKHRKELEAGKPKPVVKKVIVPKPKPKKKKVEEEEGC